MAQRGSDVMPEEQLSGGDTFDHLWNAAHEFLQAVRKLVDAADEVVEQQRHRPRQSAPEVRLHHIDIDAS
jgi:hypothetical protein